MKSSRSGLPKLHVRKGIMVFEFLGFLLAILICWMTELFDPPFSFTQVIIETIAITTLGCASLYLTWQLIGEIKSLEGLLVICAACKQVRVDGKWVAIEELILKKSELQLSHGFCPECFKKLYGEFLDES